MLATMRPFFNEHALGPKMRPSCLVCGRNDYKAVAVSHAELPGMVVCDTCKSAQSQLAERGAERELNKMTYTELLQRTQDIFKYCKLCAAAEEREIRERLERDRQADARRQALIDATRKP